LFLTDITKRSDFFIDSLTSAQHVPDSAPYNEMATCSGALKKLYDYGFIQCWARTGADSRQGSRCMPALFSRNL